MSHYATAANILDRLDMVSRAYQVIYALAGTNETPRTLTVNEARCLIGIVADLRVYMLNDEPLTHLEFILSQSMSPGMIDYVVDGRL